PHPRGPSGQEYAEGKEDTGEGSMSLIQTKTCPNNGGNLMVPTNSVSRDALVETLFAKPNQIIDHALFPPPATKETETITQSNTADPPEVALQNWNNRLQLFMKGFLNPGKDSRQGPTRTNLLAGMILATLALVSVWNWFPEMNAIYKESSWPMPVEPNTSPTVKLPDGRETVPQNRKDESKPEPPLPTIPPLDKKKPLPQLPQPSPESSTITTSLQDIFFSRDQFVLDDKAREALQNNAKILKDKHEWMVVLEGHTDERGTFPYAFVLGDKRAKTAIAYLVELGIDAHRLDFISYGNERPLCKQHTEKCYKANNRVHFRIKEPDPKPPTPEPKPIPPSSPGTPVVSKVLFQGNAVFEESELLSVSRLEVGKTIDEKAVASAVQNIRDYYGEKGYAFVEVFSDITADETSQTAIVKFIVREGELFHIRQINIYGNNLTSDFIIRELILVDEQDIFNLKALKVSHQRLLQLGLFESVKILPDRVALDKIDLNVRVQEKPISEYNEAAKNVAKNSADLVRIQATYLVLVDPLGRERVFASASDYIISRRDLDKRLRDVAHMANTDASLPPSASIKTDMIDTASGAEVFMAFLGVQDNTFPEKFFAKGELSKLKDLTQDSRKSLPVSGKGGLLKPKITSLSAHRDAPNNPRITQGIK
ncbi:MAG: OmpA family protein, partial [Nitrospirota bacterium]|nr:OmpA family protein [Nitrospirota bacterium]